MGACSSLLHGVSAPHNLCAVVCRPATGAGFFLCLSRERNQREDTPRWRSGPPLAGRSPGGWRRARGRREGTSCPVTAGSAIRADPPLRAPPAAAPPRGRTERLVASRHRAKTQQPSVAMPRSGEPERPVPFEGDARPTCRWQVAARITAGPWKAQPGSLGAVRRGGGAPRQRGSDRRICDEVRKTEPSDCGDLCAPSKSSYAAGTSLPQLPLSLSSAPASLSDPARTSMSAHSPAANARWAFGRAHPHRQ